ncbi:IclR family transcriptional regulator [Pseudoroseomonas wenyumeiae]|uniref:IclR family transcriptional regulator n=1 Tax=Teichococcus wenyumeiae TaxID=2478470 RepID=A0A3A9JP88_9PROT|nr:IclR family transcriptional regulator [Pseudoroseomonas wenyumeiae]RKK05696.1 IclR family transcriptional regulator [Pseudoroseomonas wenyumeiae]RMI25993.1 IclR family transcriptional regulator [Pseudoroseomonas wenyumeiae]
MTETASDQAGSLPRALRLLRLLGTGSSQGQRLADLADAAALPRPTVHRILRLLVAEGFVEHDAARRRYRLGLPLFLLAARAGQAEGLRDIARPSLLRLTAALGETVFLLVRNGFDAVCIDRSAGPLPILTFTGDIGGRVPLGVGQGSSAILAFLPPEEQDEVIRHNLPRIEEFGGMDEAGLRAELASVRRQGYSAAFGILPGMAGLGVPVLDAHGRAAAALSIGTTTDRMGGERRAIVAAALKKEADTIGARLNPFDPTLRRAGAAMEAAPGR